MNLCRIVCLLTVISLAGCTSQGARPPGRSVLLVVQDDAELLHRPTERVAATLDDLRDLGTDWVRITAQWNAIVPEHGTPPDWAVLDQAVEMATERGMEVSIDIAFGPPDGATLADFPAYAQAVAGRYPQAAAFTVWNEPNHPVFLEPQWREENGRWVPASPDLYRRMLYDAVPRIREAAPDALVLIGGLSSLGESEGTSVNDRMAPLTFLRALACADCPPLPGDGFAMHPYSGYLPPWEHDPQPDNVRIADLGRLRALLDELYEDGRLEEDLPIYLTEYGYQTNPPDPTWDVTPEQAARWLGEAEEIARAEPSVRSVAHFLYRDLPKRDGEENPWGDFQTGLVTLDGTPKPAHDALALPLVAHRTGPGEVRFWGLVRPGEGERSARVETRRTNENGWQTVIEVRTAADGTFERTVRADPTATYRLVADGRVGAPLNGAR